MPINDLTNEQLDGMINQLVESTGAPTQAVRGTAEFGSSNIDWYRMYQSNQRVAGSLRRERGHLSREERMRQHNPRKSSKKMSDVVLDDLWDGLGEINTN